MKRFFRKGSLVGWMLGAVLSLTALGDGDGTIAREGWSFDRSDLHWYDWAKPEEAREEGILKNVIGWTEYDFEVSQDGWYALWSAGIPASWTQTIYLDGEKIFEHVQSSELDRDPETDLFKGANLWLEEGSHTIRFHRVTFPGVLPSRWELRPGDGRAESSIRIADMDRYVVRAGQPQILAFLGGGTGKSENYELLIRKSDSDVLQSVGSLEFPASSVPVEKSVEVIFPEEAAYTLQARSGETILRPGDLKARTFIAVDVQNPPPAPDEMKFRRVVDIDCSAPPPESGFWEKEGETKVVETSFGTYRESSGLGNAGDGHWGLDGFSYRIRLPEANRLYRLRVEYPDDDRRSMGFWVNDGTRSGTAGGTINTGGVETGDQYPLSHSMKVHQSYFYPRDTDHVVVAVLNLVPYMKAAAARIQIDLVESGLAAAPLGETRGRTFGYFFEEPGRWLKFFGGGKDGISDDLLTLNRWGQWNRHIGANLMFPTINVYQANTFPSSELDGYFSTPDNEVRLATLIAEKYGSKFIPEFHLTGQGWFDAEVMGVDHEYVGEGRNRELVITYASPRAEERVIQDKDGDTRYAREAFVYNALHPDVQEKYINILGELADTLSDTEAFAGISTRMMFTWQWQGWNSLPGLNWGYDDWTISEFEKDTGIRVPGADGDPERFQERFRFLTGDAMDEWIEWRCDRIYDYHQRLLTRIRQAKPDAKLYFHIYDMNPSESYGDGVIDNLRAVGMDWERYADGDEFVLMPEGSRYGRRFSMPISDARKFEVQHEEQSQQIQSSGLRPYGIYSEYYEVNRNLDWSQLGGKPYSAFDANLPSGVYERGMYAHAMAENDTAMFRNGGSGWIFGTPELLQPFFREFRSLPTEAFTHSESVRDPVALWTLDEYEGDSFFYLVNRLPVAVEARVQVGGNDVFPAPGGSAVTTVDDVLTVKLEPFMMRAYRFKGRATVGAVEVEVPEDFVLRVESVVDSATEIRDSLEAGELAPEVDGPTFEKALYCLNAAMDAFDEGHYAKAWGWLQREAPVKIFYLTGRYPEGMWERSVPHGVHWRSTEAGELEVVFTEKEQGLPAIYDMDFGPDGFLWIASPNRLQAWDPGGKSIRELSLFAPYSFGKDLRSPTLDPVRPENVTSIRVTPENELLTQSGNQEPRYYDGQTGRILAQEYGEFLLPDRWAKIIAVHPDGRVVLSSGDRSKPEVALYHRDGRLDRVLALGNCLGGEVVPNGEIFLLFADRINVYDPKGNLLTAILDVSPEALAVSDSGLALALLTAGGWEIQLLQWDSGSREWVKSVAHRLPQKAIDLDLSPEGNLFLAFESPYGGALVHEVSLTSTEFSFDRKVVPFVEESKGLTQRTQIKEFEENLYFASGGKLYRLNPRDGDNAEVVVDPGFGGNHPEFESFAFDEDGDLYLASHWNGSARGANLYFCARDGDRWRGPVYLNGGKPVIEGPQYHPTDLHLNERGRVLLRMKNPGERWGNNFSLYYWSPDAEPELLVNLGSPADGGFGVFDLPGPDLLLAAGSTFQVLSLTEKGEVNWSSERLVTSPPGYQDFRQPLGICQDGKGRIWVTDPSRHQVMQLDDRGRIVETVGHFGNGTEGLELNQPYGIAAEEDAHGVTWLYIADSGNRRIVKWKVD
ncbi:hypothetical protein [Puniceicoccus vermicola]|uniref:Uncharacterized protein n=1 Tax=Puniceicoccus vermicola TaxID=388746 RepID=A0A7X1AZ19_9BACT|nr:hypothetical protein [Puniceicoccus vermicola]MBC2602603.1 hypothetical protein [Puniceicoccus vermicola]